jgi:hypothetical protein
MIFAGVLPLLRMRSLTEYGMCSFASTSMSPSWTNLVDLVEDSERHDLADGQAS